MLLYNAVSPMVPNQLYLNFSHSVILLCLAPRFPVTMMCQPAIAPQLSYPALGYTIHETYWRFKSLLVSEPNVTVSGRSNPSRLSSAARDAPWIFAPFARRASKRASLSGTHSRSAQWNALSTVGCAPTALWLWAQALP